MTARGDNDVVGYPVGIVGEQHYQAAVAGCSPDQSVDVLYELGNPYDELALVVKTKAGKKIGYIAHDCWLRDAIHEEGKSCSARILSINEGDHGTGVVLDVQVNGEGVGECDYQP